MIIKKGNNMKKIFLLVGIISLLAFNVYAAKNANWQTLNTSSGTPISSLAIDSTQFTEAIRNSSNVGYSSLLLEVSGQVDVTYQLSNDGSNWWTPYTTDGSTLTAAGSIASNLTASRWIILNYRVAPYIRFILSEDSASTVSAYYIQQHEQ